MAHQLVSKRRASSLASALFFVSLGFIAFTSTWWPGIIPTVGLPIALRQLLLARYYDTAITVVIFAGIFFSLLYALPWEIILPIIFVTGAIFILIREFSESYEQDEAEEEEDINHEIEEK